MIKKLFIISLSLIIIGLFCLGAKSCTGRGSKTKSGSSNYNTFAINAPSGLSATAVSFTQIDLSWQDNSNNEDGFEIERSTNGITYTLLTTTNANVTSYSDTNLIPSITYYYRVRAFNTIGDRSAYSNETNATALNVVWTTVMANGYHTIARSIDQTLLGWGRNDYFQLGLGDLDNRAVPTPIGIDTDWLNIAAGGWHNIGLKTDGTIWGWGGNEFGQLGFGDTSFDGDIPYQIGTDSDWSVVAAGGYHTFARKIDGTFYVCGLNDNGQLGLGDTNNRTELTPFGNPSEWSMIVPGQAHTIGFKTNGTLWAWGWNNNGQLGVGYSSYTESTPLVIGSDTDWSMVAAGYAHTIGLKNNGALWGWGYNGSGQLGQGNYIDVYFPWPVGTASDWSAVAAGSYHTLARKLNGSIWSWGYNYYNQLGLGDTNFRNTPSQIGIDTDWVSITAGRFHSIGIKNNGTIWMWGRNDYGQLGLGDRNNRTTPTQTGFLPEIYPPSSLAATVISPSRIDLSWADLSDNDTGFKIERKTGRNGTWGQIATVDATAITWTDIAVSGLLTYYYRVRAYNASGNSLYSNEIYIATLGDWSKVTAGWFFSIGLKTNGTIWGCGSNLYGQLGLGDTNYRYIPTSVGTVSDWSTVAAGGYYTISRKSNNTLWAWGRNRYGQLGLGDTFDRTTPTQVGTNSDWSLLAGGYAHTIARKTNNTIWTWGSNTYGQLGLGDTIDRWTPTSLGTVSDWAKITTGGYYTITRKTNGTIWTWGSNTYGQLGLGDTNNRTTPTSLGTVSDWSTIAAGKWHTLACKSNKTFWSWGYNRYAQLGLGNFTDRSIPTQVGTDSDWAAAAGGKYHTMGIKTNGTIWAWGSNGAGQLGLTDYPLQQTLPTLIGEQTDWSGEMALGDYHTLIIKTRNTLWTWGQNGYGQVGLGDTYTDNRYIPTLIPVGE
jgi:alpha-tubulin suppressor-like RCC1 family protein